MQIRYFYFDQGGLMGTPKAISSNVPLEDEDASFFDDEWIGNYYWGKMTPLAISWIIASWNRLHPESPVSLVIDDEPRLIKGP